MCCSNYLKHSARKRFSPSPSDDVVPSLLKIYTLESLLPVFIITATNSNILPHLIQFS